MNVIFLLHYQQYHHFHCLDYHLVLNQESTGIIEHLWWGS